MMVGDDDDDGGVVNNYGTWMVQIDQAALSLSLKFFWDLNISHMVGLAFLYL